MNERTADPLDRLRIDTVRFLSVDAVQKANSGHPGLPLGSPGRKAAKPRCPMTEDDKTNGASVLAADDGLLRAAGLSSGKLATLRRVGDALARGWLDERMLEERSSRAAATRLRGIKGIGPWSATVILIRGLARLDVFPADDTSVARNLAFVARSTPADIEGVLRARSPRQGMLYYLLLLARLEAGHEIGRAKSAPEEIA